MKSSTEKDLKVKVPITGTVEMEINEKTFDAALKKSQLYWEIIKPRLDLSKTIEFFIEDKKDFYLEFYENQPTSLANVLALLSKHEKK